MTIYVVCGLLALAAVFVFLFALASMMKKVLKGQSVAWECFWLFLCGLSVYGWILSLFSTV